MVTRANRIGQLLRGFRASVGISQDGLARKAGLDPSYISRLERGGRTQPSMETLLKIAEVLGLRSAQRDALLSSAGYGAVRFPLSGLVGFAAPVLKGRSTLPRNELLDRLAALLEDDSLSAENKKDMLRAIESLVRLAESQRSAFPRGRR